MSYAISQRDEPMYQIASSRGSQLKGVDCSSWRLHSSGMIQTEMNARCHARISLSYGEVQQDGDEYHEAGVRFYPTDELMLIHKGVPSEKPQPIIIIPTHWSMHATSYTLSELG